MLVTDLEFLPDVYSCACGHCRKRFSAEAGIELPAADNHNFWENRENPDFLAWIGARYRWSSEHYQRLRKRMPPEVLLCGCASSCLEPSQAAIGFSPQHAAEHWDVIFYEISPVNGSGADSPDIATELVAFDSLARHQQKPLVALCHVNSPHELPRWLHRLQGCHARPWISKRIRRENPIPEEQLLASGYSFPKTQKPKPPPSGSAQAIIFSESFRDRLPPRQADNYVDQCRSLCNDLIARGSQPQFLFDSMWKAASPEPWDCLWTVDPRALDPERETKLQTWQDTGLAVGVA